MANFNKVMLMGNLTRDPQLSYLPSQTPVVEFGLAVNRKWTSKEGESKEEVCFVDCRAFSRLAENINKYMRKGRPIFVEGRLVFEQWTAQDGSKRSKHRIHVDNCQFLGGGPGGPGAGTGTEAGAGGEAGPDSQVEPDNSGPVKGAHPPADDIPF
ncbi:MAG TPA: single-stranded DNA-binding protein [Sedimentisphaerales bacterium]|jgi:single-strand DNA-binding protein